MTAEPGSKNEPAAATPVAANTPEPAAGAPVAAPNQIADLMAGATARKQRPDLEAQALRAAEAALAEGQQALAEARAQLQPGAARAGSRRRELVLRVLLVVNVLAMIAVLLLPDPQPAAPVAAAPVPAPIKPPEVERPVVRNDADPYLRSLEAADHGDYARAIALLDKYLEDTPRLKPNRRALVFRALAGYALQLGRDDLVGEYERRAAALQDSHSLPEDLIEEAKSAAARGDAEALRRLYARFLLQQRQIPASLYKHVAEAYLKLGDSYRMAAQQADETQQRHDLEQLRQQLRAQDPGKDQPPGKPQQDGKQQKGGAQREDH